MVEVVDPGLVKYRETRRIETGFHWPRDIATHDGDVWIVGDMSVKRITPSSDEAEVLRFNDSPMAVAVAPGGGVYVATSDAVVPLESKPWPSLGPRARIVSLAATRDEVWAADAGNRQVVRYGRNGREIGRLEGFIVPSPYFGLCAHGDDMIVCNPGEHRVERYRNGKQIHAFGEQGQEIERFCGCCNPTHLAALPSGDIVASEKGIPRVKVLSPEGTLKAVVAPPESFNVQTTGLSLAVDGKRILALDPWEGVVRVFDAV